MESKYPRDARRDLESYQFATKFLTAIGSPLAGAARQRNPLPLISAEVNFDEPCTQTFRDAYWAAESFSKLPFEVEGVDRVQVAYQKFWEAEEKCQVANSRLVDWRNRLNLPYRRLERARQLIASVLGEFSWDRCEPFFSFGPGATTSLPRRKAQRSNKWEFGTHITRHCLPLLLAFCRKYDSSSMTQKAVVVAGNKVTTVPKNAKTDRVIAIEPDWNMFFQRGIGGAIRHRLRSRLGLLRPDSQETHQRLAK